MELGEALVIAMLVIALVGALIVFTSDAIRESQAQERSNDSSRPLQWLNLSSSDAIDEDCSWVGQIRSSLSGDEIVLANLASPAATTSQIAQLLGTNDAHVEVDLATVWLGPEDFLAGTQILEFEEGLAAILSWLTTRKAAIVVGNLPDLAPELVAAKLAHPRAVRPVIDQWNASIARLASSFGGMLVDLDVPLDPASSPTRYLLATRFEPNSEAQSFVAERFAPEIERVLGSRVSGD